MIELEKDPAAPGLGISLAGSKDGSRARMSVYVEDIDPQGPAGLDGRILVGDELLEVKRRENGAGWLTDGRVFKGQERSWSPAERRAATESSRKRAVGRGCEEWMSRDRRGQMIYQTNYCLTDARCRDGFEQRTAV